MEQIPTDSPSFLFLVAYIVIRDAIIPLLNKLIPAKVQQQADKEAHAVSIEERETKALEEISRAVTQSAERLTSIEIGQSTILLALKSQSEALVVLVDRVGRKATPRK